MRMGQRGRVRGEVTLLWLRKETNGVVQNRKDLQLTMSGFSWEFEDYRLKPTSGGISQRLPSGNGREVFHRSGANGSVPFQR